MATLGVTLWDEQVPPNRVGTTANPLIVSTVGEGGEPADIAAIAAGIGTSSDAAATVGGAGSLNAKARLESSLVGSLTETAPTNDTNSSGLNGRLQRIAQRLTSLIALIPASLGQKTKATSFAVTLASDEDLLVRQGSLTEAAPANDTDSSGLNGRLQRISQRLTTLIGSVLSVIFPVRTWTDIAPATVAITAGTDLIAAASGGNFNIISDIGFQNVTATAADLTLKKGGTTFAVYTIPPNSALEIGWIESAEWRFAGIFNAVAGTASAIKVTHGRFRVGLI